MADQGYSRSSAGRAEVDHRLLFATPPSAGRITDMDHSASAKDRPAKQAKIPEECKVRFVNLRGEKATLNGREGRVVRQHPMNSDLWMVEYPDDLAQKISKAFSIRTLERLAEDLDDLAEGLKVEVEAESPEIPVVADLVKLDVTDALSGRDLCSIGVDGDASVQDIIDLIRNQTQIPCFDLVIGTEVLQTTTMLRTLIPPGSKSASISLLRCSRDRTLVPQLRAAIGNGHLTAVLDLLRRCSDFDLPDAGAPALHHAAKFAGSGEAHRGPTAGILQALLNHKADVNARDRQNRLALHFVGDSERCVQMLLDARSEVNSQCNSGFTPLLKAAKAGNAEVLQALLEHNADVNAVSANSESALHIFVRAEPSTFGRLHARSAFLQMLLNAGIDVNGKNSSGQTALHICAWLHGQNICPDDNEATRARIVAAGAH